MIGITNLRGKDIDFNPVFFSYAILFVDGEEAKLSLYSNQIKFDTDEIRNHLKENKITLNEYNSFYDVLTKKDDTLDNYLIVADKGSLNQNLFNLITSSFESTKYKIIDKDVIEHTKNIKSEREMKGLRDCHVRDGAALVKYFAWLEDQLLKQNRTDLNEYEGALKSRDFREKGELFMGESFDAISSSGANAAIIHYKPDEKTSSIIQKENIYLLDSGGQYM